MTSSGIGSTEIIVTDSCEPLNGCWESNSGLLKEQQMFLTVEAFFFHLKLFKKEPAKVSELMTDILSSDLE